MSVNRKLISNYFNIPTVICHVFLNKNFAASRCFSLSYILVNLICQFFGLLVGQNKQFTNVTLDIRKLLNTFFTIFFLAK